MANSKGKVIVRVVERVGGKKEVSKDSGFAPTTMSFTAALNAWSTLSKEEQTNQLLNELLRVRAAQVRL